MSAEADVAEMKSLCGELADRLAGSDAYKDRVRTVQSKLGLSWNRAMEFLRGKARLVQSWEKDHARAVLRELREAEQRRREQDHLVWLRQQIDRARATGEEFHGPHVDGLEHVFRLARDPGSAVEISGGEPAGAATPYPET